MTILDEFREKVDIQDLAQNGKKEVSQSSQYLFDQLMGDAPFGKSDDSSDEFNGSYELTRKDFYEEIYGRDEEEFSFDKFDLSDPMRKNFLKFSI